MTQTHINPEDLAHYGVVGMKWGKRKAKTESRDRDRAAAKEIRTKKPKLTTNEIHNARLRNQVRREEFNRLAVQFDRESTARGKAKVEKQMETIGKEFYKDAEVAKRATRGEKVGNAIFAVGGALFVASLVAAKAGR